MNALERCRYCGAAVESDLMGYHYGGYKQPACEAVRWALDKSFEIARPARRLMTAEEHNARRAAGKKRARAMRAQKAALREQGIRI